MIGPGGTAYVAGSDLVALDREGNLRWVTMLSSYGGRSIAFSDGTVFAVGEANGNVMTEALTTS